MFRETDPLGRFFTAPYNDGQGFTDKDCPECGRAVQGEGVYATGAKLPEYSPSELEWLKNIFMVCPHCGWNQYS
mgnify:FL=1